MTILACLIVTLLVLGGWVLPPANAAEGGASGLLRCGEAFAKGELPNPNPQADPEAIARFRAINRDAGTGSHGMVFLGDSITQNWDASVWDEHFAPLNALNAGVNGDRTEHLLWRIDHGNLDGQQLQIVVLLIGTNDIGIHRRSNVVAEEVRQILTRLRSRSPAARILLLGILPRGDFPTSHRRQQVKDVNQLIQACGDDQYVYYADVADTLLDRVGRFSRALSPDGVHLSKEGYARLSDRLERELDRFPPSP